VRLGARLGLSGLNDDREKDTEILALRHQLAVLQRQLGNERASKDAGIDSAPERACSTWAGFLRSQAKALLACNFYETVTLSGAQRTVQGPCVLPPLPLRAGAVEHALGEWGAIWGSPRLEMKLDRRCMSFIIG
jgi:hypothetical protein